MLFRHSVITEPYKDFGCIMIKILIADDEPYIRELLLTTLSETDYEFLTAKDGEEVLKIAREEKPDLILLDIMMPQMNGYDVCEKIKSSPETKSIKVIMLTALGENTDKKKGFMVGADDYFSKPFSPSALVDKIKDIFK